MAAATRQLSTAAERREALIGAAVDVFAERGFHGTPTTEIAKAAGISQAYLFRLFPTKSELYVAAIERCYERLWEPMQRGADAARAIGVEPLDGMALAYLDLLQDRTILRATLHAFAAGTEEDEAIRAAVRAGYGELYHKVQRLSGADEDRMRTFFAQGMLCTVMAGMDAGGIDADWARSLLGMRVAPGAFEERLANFAALKAASEAGAPNGVLAACAPTAAPAAAGRAPKAS
ncbi:MAG TPA: TetR/AcrR family transcriptional regulator [Conexibacter sp.]|jgi:AcrR family transcriptional regulator